MLSILREGVETALIVMVVAGFLRPIGRRSTLRWILIGVGLVIMLCLQYGGLARVDEITWRGAFDHILNTMEGVRAMLGL